MKEDFNIAIIGLGYVGLPLAIEFGKKYKTIGFDLSELKIESYKNNLDPTGEVSRSSFEEASNLQFSNNTNDLVDSNIFIVAVPTPIDEAHVPDLTAMQSACEVVGRNMKKGATIIFESTVYPGLTEEFCAPILEKVSGLVWKVDFNLGYSPERISPGDKERTLTKIIKVVSGDNKETLKTVSFLYKSIISAGVYEASSIMVAEAAKVIENTQRDINIALVNELAIIFNKMDIDTNEVLDAAGTKWNFMPFKPGLVGGHCIGVDPYYLTYKSEMLGYHPEVILAGRRINDGVSSFIAQNTIKHLINAGSKIKNANVAVFGITFKEDCPDMRNSKVVDLVNELKDFGCNLFIHDPEGDPAISSEAFGIDLVQWEDLPDNLDAIILSVPHKFYKNKDETLLLKNLSSSGIIIDIKSILPKNYSKHFVWRL